MVIDVLGYERMDFPDDKDPSRRVLGYQVYYGEPIRDRGEGIACSKKFISDDRIKGKVSLGAANMDIQLSVRGKPFVGSFAMIPSSKVVSS